MKVVVSEKGQFTIPKKLRDRLGIRPGQVLEVDEERGRLVAEKACSADALELLVGAFPSKLTTDELLEELRGPVVLP